MLNENMTYITKNAGEMPYQLSPSEQLLLKGWDLLQPIVLWLANVPPTQSASATPASSRPGSSATGSPSRSKLNNISNLAISMTGSQARPNSQAPTSSPALSIVTATSKSPAFRSSRAPLTDISLLVNWTASALSSTRLAAPEADSHTGLIPSTDVIQDLYLRLEFIQTLSTLQNILSTLASSKNKADPRPAQLRGSSSTINNSAGSPTPPQDISKILAELRRLILQEAQETKQVAGEWAAKLQKSGAKDTVGKLLQVGPTGLEVSGILEGWTLLDKRVTEFWGAAIESIESVTRVNV
jgi:hypothetical protein